MSGICEVGCAASFLLPYFFLFILADFLVTEKAARDTGGLAKHAICATL